MKDKKIGIVGAGLTGLVAAKELTKKGFNVTIIEKLNIPGGRIRTEVIEGWNLDVGFQVLLTAYPYLKKHVDFEKLDLVHLDAGATIFTEGKELVVGDPTRVKNIFWKTVFSSIGSLKDKFLIFKLKLEVDKLSDEAIFELENKSSYQFLKDFGFSDKIITQFFSPFFSGIFLENKLKTSSRMMLFVFKMFSKGSAAIPRNGVGQLAKHIEEQLENVEIIYNQTVKDIKEKMIVLESGQLLKFDFIINTIPSNNHNWHNSDCYYFEHDGPRLIEEQRIGLNANKNQFINNIFYPSSITKPDNKKDKELISLTVVDRKNLSTEELKTQVEQELIANFGLKNLKFIKHYSIPKSLPNLEAPSHKAEMELKGNSISVGDFLSNGSQNAACKTGEEVSDLLVKSM